MIGSARQGPTLSGNANVSYGGGAHDIARMLSSLDAESLSRIQASIAQNPYLARLLGGGGASRDPFTGRFQAPLRAGAMPPPHTSGAATSYGPSAQYMRDMHMLAGDIHTLVRLRTVGGGIAPLFGGHATGRAVHPAAAAYGGYAFAPGTIRVGGASVPPSGPPMGPWGPRGGGYGGGAGGGGGGYGGGGGGGHGWGGAAFFGPRGPVAHYGILRGLLVGRIAAEIGGDMLKDFINPARMAAEMQGALLASTNRYTNIAKPYYALATAGGFSGSDALRRMLPPGTAGGSFEPPSWMSQYGITNAQVAGAFNQFGIVPRSGDQFERMAQNLTVNPMLPGFAGLDQGIPLGLARQAAGAGFQSTEGATDSYLRKLSEYGAHWTEEGIDRAKVFQSMAGALDILSKTGTTGIDADRVARLFDRLATSGLPGGRTGALGMSIMQGDIAASNRLGHDPLLTGLVASAIQAHGGLNAKGVEWALGPEALKQIGGTGSQQFKDIVNAFSTGQYPAGMSLLGQAFQGTGQVSAALDEALARMGIPKETRSAIIYQQTGVPPSVYMGYRGASKWTSPSSKGGDYTDMMRRAAARYHVNPEDVLGLASAEGYKPGNPYSNPDMGGTSYGPLQMRSGGPGGGLADDFRRDTGLDPADPANAAALIDYGVYRGTTTGWGSWSTVKSGKARVPRMMPSPGAASNGVNASLNSAMQYAASMLPKGYSARMTSGRAGRTDRRSMHSRGLAEDWEISGPNGVIPNRGQDTSGMYQQMAVNALAWLQQNDPSAAANFAWGGHFGTQLGGGGPPDLMHYDLGGVRGHFGDPNAERKILAARGGGGTVLASASGDSSIQVAPGAGVAPRAEATGAAAGATDLKNFQDIVNSTSGAIAQFGQAISKATGIINKLATGVAGGGAAGSGNTYGSADHYHNQ